MNQEQSTQRPPPPPRTDWSPSRFFDSKKPVHPFALILLNQPLNWTAFEKISRSACITVCADGGANRLHQESSKNGFSNPFIPNAIIGDLDSLTPSVEAFYRSKDVAIIRDPDQYSTDFTKCLKWLRQNLVNNNSTTTSATATATATATTQRQEEEEEEPAGPSARLDVVALGGLGGRVDQGFSQIHHLYMATRHTDLLVGEIYLLSEQSLSFVLQEGLNRIHLCRETFAQNVGIIPITGPAVISTKGLEWDVQEWKTEFGGQISTSNHLISETIDVETTTRVLFTVELAEDLTVKVTIEA